MHCEVAIRRLVACQAATMLFANNSIADLIAVTISVVIPG
jgi:hypothetical protein